MAGPRYRGGDRSTDRDGAAMLGVLKVWWPWAIMITAMLGLSFVFWWTNRVWLVHHDDLEGCRHWCQTHVKYDTPEKYVKCVRKCKVTIDAP